MSRPPSLAWRITASCLVVAGVAVGVAGLVSVRAVRSSAGDVARQALSEQADVLAAQLADAGPIRELRVAQVLRAQGVSIVPVPRPGGPVDGPTVGELDAPGSAGGAPGAAAFAAGAGRVLEGEPVSGAARAEGREWLVEARPARAGGFALVSPAVPAPAVGRLLGRGVGFALLVGGLAAVVVGLGLARVLARPLRRTAQVARRMRAGHRDDRVPVEGPAEVAEVARTVNELADALARSEGRQREFLLSVSHELRTPLTAITGFAESLADGVITGDAVADAGRTIGREARRLDRLVGDLLQLARLGADEFPLDVAEIDLTALLGEAAAVWSARCAAAGARLALDVPDGALPVRTDPRRLRQVLDQLAENALRVLPAGAPLVFALRPDGAGGAVLEVRDGGPGLDDEDYAVAFQPGRLHRRYQGRRATGSGGIGLALVHALVTRLGGAIDAGPAGEGGARFVITLPDVPASGGRG